MAGRTEHDGSIAANQRPLGGQFDDGISSARPVASEEMNRPMLAILGLSFATSLAWAAEEASPAFQQARAGLEQNCFKCHGHAANKSKGGLLLDSREAMLAGGATGPAVVAGRPEESLLLKAVSHRDPDLQMPPKDGRLPEADIAALTELVKAGAP